jgi:hypothetical protein
MQGVLIQLISGEPFYMRVVSEYVVDNVGVVLTWDGCALRIRVPRGGAMSLHSLMEAADDFKDAIFANDPTFIGDRNL